MERDGNIDNLAMVFANIVRQVAVKSVTHCPDREQSAPVLVHRCEEAATGQYIVRNAVRIVRFREILG